nr:glycosyltransferase [Ilumatobacter nonamiensis]
MPTLLNVNNYHYRRGGADVMHLEQSRLFRTEGWEVVDFAMRHPDNLDSPWSDYFVDEIEFGRDYSFRERAVAAGRVVHSPQARRRIGDLIDRTRPDIAHLHNVYHHISPSILPTLHRRGVPTVLTTHDLKLACPAYRMITDDAICERCKGGRIHNVIRRRCIKDSAVLSSVVFAETALHRTMGTFARCVDRFISPSRFYIDKFVEWGFDASQFVRIPNYVRPDDFMPAEKAGRDVVYLGRLAPEKGLATLVSAVHTAGVALTIAGTGPDHDALRQQAASLGAEVTFLGHVGGPDLHDLVRSARAVVLPSEWYENAPVSVLEAYALATPVVGASIGGITELVQPGRTGWLFRSGDVGDLADALRVVRQTPDATIVEMGRAGRSWVEEEFTDRHYLERTLDVYRSIGVQC